MKCEWKHCVSTGDFCCVNCKMHSTEELDLTCDPDTNTPLQGIGESNISSCRHIKLQSGESKCGTCRGNVRIKIFQCDVHMKCTLKKKIEDIACCATCGDYQESH